MADVVRIYPESKTGLINYIEKHFHDIDEFVVTFTLKDSTTMTVYDCYSYISALGICALTNDTIQKTGDDFIPKVR